VDDQSGRGAPSSAADAASDSAEELLRTAERFTTNRVPVTSLTEPVSDLLGRLRGSSYDTAAVAAVCEGNMLVGLVTIERLLAAPSAAVVGDIADREPPTVSPDTHQELVAWTALQHGEPAIAVIDARGEFGGIIPSQALLGVLLEEHDEDLARLGGYLSSTSAAQTASTEGVQRRLLHRLPWLLVGFVGALLAALVVGAFSQQLEEQVLIAYFVPGVVYIAAAVGMQTETLVIRGFSLGVGIRRVVGRELATGALLGITLAGLAFPIIWLGWGDVAVAASVAVAMLAASSTATGVALCLPWALQRLGKDPAFGSGPIATVLQDLLTVTIYFLSATAITH
jgi:magnesium transporter